MYQPAEPCESSSNNHGGTVTRMLLLLGLLFVALPALATTRYIAATAGTFSGGSACNGQTAITPATWNSTPESPGDISYICGTITGTAGQQLLNFGWSGSSGNPTQLVFDTGAVLTSPYWSASGAIQCNGYSYITVNGGTNGIIQNTANGTGLTYQANSSGVYFENCPHSTIENLTVQNIYVATAGDNNSNNGSGIEDYYGDFVSIHNNTVTYSYEDITLGYSPSASYTSVQVYDNTADYACHFIELGDGSGGSSASGINIYNNTLGPHQNAFIEASGGCHTDGIFLNAVNTGSAGTNVNIYNNIVASDGCVNGANETGAICTAKIYLAGGWSNVYVFNNTMYSNFTFNPSIANQGDQGTMIFDNNQNGSGVTQSNIQIYNNVFGGDQGDGNNGGYQGLLIHGTGGSQTGFVVENNIFYEYSYCGVCAANGTVAADFTTIGHNIYYNFSNSLGNGTSMITGYTTLAAAQAAGFEAGGSTGNPNFNCVEQFNSPPSSCYQLQSGSAAIGSGANLTSLGITALDADLAGVARPTSGNWAAGAYQFSGAPGSSGAPAPPTALTASAQ